MKNLREFQLEIDINATKDQVWNLLFNKFGEVNLFNPELVGSHHTNGVSGEVGCERQCDINSRTSVHERITAVRGTDSFDIDVIKSGMPLMDKMRGTWDLKAIGQNKTKAVLTMRFNTKPAFLGFILKVIMKKMVFRMLIGLKYHLETGNLVTKENIKGIVKDYNNLEAKEAFAIISDMALA